MPDHRSELIHDAASRAAKYAESARDAPVFPTQDALDNLARFSERLPDGPSDPETVLSLLDEIGSPATVKSTGGRYFGFVTGGVEPAAAAAAMLAGAWDQNGAIPVMSPISSRLDAISASWIRELLGLPDTAVPGFCSGDTVANMTGVLVGRDAILARAGWDVRERGLSGSPPIQVVVSEETHASAMRALRIAGFGREQMHVVPSDHLGRIDISQFPDLQQPAIVMLQAGNVNTGHSDQFTEIIPRVHEAGGWVHIDGAFGLWAAVSPKLRHQIAGADQADSWALDCHKWLNVPYDSGIAICAREEDMLRTMTDGAAYLVGSDEQRVPLNLGLQMSQRARWIEFWALVAARGRSRIAEIVEMHCRQAADMAEKLKAAGATILAPVVLNQVLVTFDDDATTEDVIRAVQEDRTCWAGGTAWKGRKAMRISVSDTATSDDDVERSAAAIIRCWQSDARGFAG